MQGACPPTPRPLAPSRNAFTHGPKSARRRGDTRVAGGFRVRRLRVCQHMTHLLRPARGGPALGRRPHPPLSDHSIERPPAPWRADRDLRRARPTDDRTQPSMTEHARRSRGGAQGAIRCWSGPPAAVPSPIGPAYLGIGGCSSVKWPIVARLGTPTATVARRPARPRRRCRPGRGTRDDAGAGPRRAGGLCAETVAG